MSDNDVLSPEQIEQSPMMRRLTEAVEKALPTALAQAAACGIRPNDVVFIVISDDAATREEAAEDFPNLELAVGKPTVIWVSHEDFVGNDEVVAHLREAVGPDIDLSKMPDACRVWFYSAGLQGVGHVRYVDSRRLGHA